MGTGADSAGEEAETTALAIKVIDRDKKAGRNLFNKQGEVASALADLLEDLRHDAAHLKTLNGVVAEALSSFS